MEIFQPISALLLVSLVLAWRQKAVRIFEYLVTLYLRNINPIRNSAGGTIPSPGWIFPNGHMGAKFVEGELYSSKWRQLGPVYRIWAGTTPEMFVLLPGVITTPEQIRNFYTDSNAHLKSHACNGGWLFDEMLGSCMGLINGMHWRALRMAFEDVFGFREMETSYATIFNFASAYVQDLAEDEAHSFRIDPFQELKQYPLFCAAIKIYGNMTVMEKQELWDLALEHNELMGYVLAGGRYRYKNLQFTNIGINRQLRRFNEKWMTFNRSMYETRASSRSERFPIVTIWEGASKDSFTHREVLHTLTEILFANLDVASHVLCWLIVLLAENPGIQSEVRSKSRSAIQNSSLLGAHAMRKDTLLGMAFLECLRLKPFTAFSMPEASGENKFFDGYCVPKNTSVIIDTAAINIKNSFWGQDREEFLPERFRRIKISELRYNFFAFGFGPRKCQGHYFAELSIKSFVALLLHNFELRTSSETAKHVTRHAQEGERWIQSTERLIRLRRLECKVNVDTRI